MMTLLLHSGLLSIDSLVVSLALSPLIQSQAQRWRWAALFGICDGLAGVIGFTFGGVEWGIAFAHHVVPLFLIICGIYCLVAACWTKFRADPRLASILPVLMSFDNLAYGVGAHPLTNGIAVPAALLGLASFSLAMLGFQTGSVIRFRDRRAAEWSAGFALAAASCVLFIS